jgi:hypothetical protein
MTRDDLLSRLAALAGNRPGRTAGSRGVFTSWALQAENLFDRAFGPKESVLVRYKAAIERLVQGGGDWITVVHAVNGAFDACRLVLENAPGTEIDTRLAAHDSAGSGERVAVAPARDRQDSSASQIRLFLSHASVDAPLAELVARLFRSALGLTPETIRCTSVDGYRLPGGADTDEQLRIEVHQAEVLVGIISVASLDSLYVAFELGARWGANKSLIPLMAPGVSPSAMKGPLGGKNALRSDSAGQLQQLVSDVGKQLALTPYPPASYQSDIDAILALARRQIAAIEEKEATGGSAPLGTATSAIVRIPRVVVRFVGNGDVLNVTVITPTTQSALEKAALVADLRGKHPPLSPPEPVPELADHERQVRRIRELIGDEEEPLEKYNARLERYFTECEEWLEKIEQHAAKMAWSVRLELEVRNEGTAPGKDIDVILAAPAGVAFYEEDDKALWAPHEPRPPKRRVTRQFDPLRTPAFNPASLSSIFDRGILPLDPRVDVARERVVARTKKLKHGDHFTIPPFLLLWENQPGPVRLQYTVSMEELPERPLAELTIVPQFA